MHNACAHMYVYSRRLFTSKISWVVFIGMSWQKHAATFRGQWNFKVRQDFEEIRYQVQFKLIAHAASAQVVPVLYRIMCWMNIIPCSRKYWWELNLVVGP